MCYSKELNKAMIEQCSNHNGDINSLKTELRILKHKLDLETGMIYKALCFDVEMYYLRG